MACHYCFYRDEVEKRKQECYGLMSSRTLAEDEEMAKWMECHLPQAGTSF